MPNHLHGIVSLSSAADDFDNKQVAAGGQTPNRFPLVREIVHAFKARCAFYLESNGYPEKNGSEPVSVWQRNHHQHVIGDEKAYLDIVQYIENEPQQWRQDIYNVPRSHAAFRAPLTATSGLQTGRSSAGVLYG